MRSLGAKPSSFFVANSCRGDLNGFWEAVADTRSGRWWYKNFATLYSLYWDANCDGMGGLPGSWIFDTSDPSVTDDYDLDGKLVAHNANMAKRF
jgi:hypothetical protein